MLDNDQARRNQLRHQKSVKTQENIKKLSQRSQHIAYDFSRRVAIYARQSNFIQKERNEQSFKDQTEGQRLRAIEMGWSEDQIDIILTDMDNTATTDIDDREGLSDLLHKIQQGVYGAVIAYMEDRLFRDEYLDNATRFARACSQNNCYLITERYAYDMSDEMERERFYMEVRYGWAYYKNQVLGHLHGHRQSARRDGIYVGQYMPVGYSICRYKDEKQYKRFIPVASHGEIVRQWYQRFVELDGNFSQLYYELLQQPGHHFPPIDDPIYRAKSRLTPCPNGGWRLTSRSGLRAVLTNRQYIGDLCADGTWLTGQHEAIIEKELFYRVQALLEEHPLAPRSRYKPTPLLLHKSGKFHGEGGGAVTYAIDRGGLYRTYTMENRKAIMLLSVSAQVIEDAFFHLLLDNIAATTDFQDFTSAADEVREKRERQRAGIGENIAAIEASMTLEETKMEAAKGHGNLQTVVLKAMHKLSTLTARKEELEQKLKNVPDDDRRLLELTDLLHTLREHTHNFDITALQELTVLAVKDVLLRTLTRHFILLRVEWQHIWPTQDIVIYRKLSGRDEPEPEELAFLKAHFMTMEINELLEAVPGMSLDSIMTTMKKEGYRRKNVPGTMYKSRSYWKRHDATGLKYDPRFSVEDYEVMERYDIALKDVQTIKERGIWKKQEYEVMAVSCITNDDGSAQTGLSRMAPTRPSKSTISSRP